MRTLNRSEIQENQRWEELHGDPLKTDAWIRADHIQIGDEFFSITDLEKEELAPERRPVLQPDCHPFKPHHYDLQRDLDEIIAHFKRYPERKGKL